MQNPARRRDSADRRIKRADGEEEMYAYDFIGKRYDVGNKLGFLQATVEFALARDDLKEEFEAYLKEIICKL